MQMKRLQREDTVWTTFLCALALLPFWYDIFKKTSCQLRTRNEIEVLKNRVPKERATRPIFILNGAATAMSTGDKILSNTANLKWIWS